MNNDIGYIVDGDKVAELISYHIYNAVSSLVENIANFYDADSKETKINFKETKGNDNNIYITEIKITGDGDGISLNDLNNLPQIANSKKRKKLHTEKFNRAYLGAFGIAFTSFRVLGDMLDIYSKNDSKETYYRNISIINGKAVFSKIELIEECNMIEYETGCTLIIKNCKILKSIFMDTNTASLNHDLLKNKLSYLPVSDNFKIKLCDEEVNKFMFDDDCYKKTFSFNIQNIEFDATIYYTKLAIKNMHYRGIFLKVDERIIDWNIYSRVRERISSPGAVDYKIHGYITANGLRNKINASRNGLTDYSISSSILEIVRKNIYNISKKAREYYSWNDLPKKKKDNREEEIHNINQGSKKIITNIKDDIIKSDKIINQMSHSISIEYKESYNKVQHGENAKNRLKNCNDDLKRLELKFCYEPKAEVEVIVITSQMCQEGLLNFEIVEVTYKNYYDAIIYIDGNLKFLEFEKTLHNFFVHEHSHNDVDYILCWDINENEIDSKIERYLKKFSKYIKNIDYNENEVIFNDYDGNQHVIKLYVLSNIIKRL